VRATARLCGTEEALVTATRSQRVGGGERASVLPTR
jgi:hypothetical protein